MHTCLYKYNVYIKAYGKDSIQNHWEKNCSTSNLGIIDYYWGKISSKIKER